MKTLFLFPGEFAGNIAGLAPGSDNRMILRMFINTLVWSAVGSAMVLTIML